MASLPVLMYHNVSEDKNKSFRLTISTAKLEEQFRYFSENNYTTFHFSELENRIALPPKSIVITFDDVTTNQFLYAVPLLKKYGLKATFFIPFYYLGKTDEWNKGTENIMTIKELQAIDPSLIEFGHHSSRHRHYAKLSDAEIQEDFDESERIIAANGLKVYPALAFPYGNYPKKEPQKSRFQELLKKNNIKFGVKIGNRRNKFPFKNTFEVQRIDVKGEDSFLKFKLKLKFGKLKLF